MSSETESGSALLSQATRPGTKMVEITACHRGPKRCTRRLIDPEAWVRPVEAWVEKSGLEKRLAERLKGESHMAHQRLRIAVSGCPNGCARHQIADLAIVGATRPSVEKGKCMLCGRCVDKCPDGAFRSADEAKPPVWLQEACLGCLACETACETRAITLLEPWARIFVGGKLGRHPRLATLHREVDEPYRAVGIMEEIVSQFLIAAPGDLRFSAWWAETRKGDF